MTFEKLNDNCKMGDLNMYTIYEEMYMWSMRNFMNLSIAKEFYTIYMQNVDVNIFGNGLKLYRSQWNHLRHVVVISERDYKK